VHSAIRRLVEQVRGVLGLGVERDLYWTPKTLEDIAPELFESLTVSK